MPPPAPSRPSGLSKKQSSSLMRPPARSGVNRAQTATPTLHGRASPADPSSGKRTPKRKASPEPLQDAGEETNINVVVRCRGRSDREVKENSGVVVSSDGMKGKKVVLSMGANALSNKTYEFDKVFSPAADQGIVFDEVVSPILDEVLRGFNCTIFAYGQTGTGKTYTMSGDISDSLPTPDAAGIIPRVLHTLFDRLGDEGVESSENNVKCSFIELYNEELRDLLSPDDAVKLKIYDEANKHGRTTTLVQGMEETNIQNASKGIQMLREGSHKRQVAATKCNDLSSRSHTVFTVTVQMKRTSDTGEDHIAAGKLNLVDLAGSENIQRSGAENKRAVEAGVINKSLLTLGRVINALVDKGSHIPYRESKLTRLLQDSLGGRTKTCIIATLSPAKSNLEETISTLDYAFRAKNIRNKPQVNQMVSKKTLLREFTVEIEKLKSELIATRQRNGVYLTSESYEEITTESESRRILSEEQREKIETIESRLHNKTQELFSLGANFHSLKKDNEQTRMMLDGTKSVLEKTEIVLNHTKKTLEEETHLREAHQLTEEQLATVGGDLLNTLDTTTDHVDKLHSKLRRRSNLQSVNRTRWTDSQEQVSSMTSAVEDRMEALRGQQESLVATLSGRMQTFVADELQQLQSSRTFLQDKVQTFEKSESEVNAQTTQSKDEMNEVLEEIRTLREDVKQKVGAGLSDLSAATQRIGAGIATELDSFHDQLQGSYVSLGRELKTIFEDLVRRMNEQQAEAESLRQQMAEANSSFAEASRSSQVQLQQAMDEEKQTAAAEREALLAKVASLINDSATTQEARMSGRVESASKRVNMSEDTWRIAQQSYGNGMDIWNSNARALIDSSVASRDSIKSKLKNDWTIATDQTCRLTETTKAVHGETTRIVDGQMAQMDSQLVALDEIVARVRAQNEEHHKAHTDSLSQLAGNVQESYQSIGKHFETSYDRTKGLERDVLEPTNHLSQTLGQLASNSDIRQPLQALRHAVADAPIVEYTATGETPVRVQYAYPTTIPRTENHDILLNRLRGIPTQSSSPKKLKSSPTKSPLKRSPTKPSRLPTTSSPIKPTFGSSPSKPSVFTDSPPTLALNVANNHPSSAPSTRPTTAPSATATFQPPPPSLRELNINVPLTSDYAVAPPAPDSKEYRGNPAAPPLKRAHTAAAGLEASEGLGSGGESRLPAKKARIVAEGRENVAPVASLGVEVGGGRVLRSSRSSGGD